MYPYVPQAEDGWTADDNEPWTYASATTFTVTGDQTAKFSKGTRLKLTQTTVKYFVVVASSFASGTTTVTLTGGSDYTFANAAISANSYSYAASPQGYPGWFNFAPSATGFSGSPTVNAAKFAVQGRTCFIEIDITGTSNATTFTITLPISAAVTPAEWLVFGINNGANVNGPCLGEITPGTTLSFYKDPTGAGWTASGTKRVITYIHYEI
jgi:hypothetical protein